MQQEVHCHVQVVKNCIYNNTYLQIFRQLIWAVPILRCKTLYSSLCSMLTAVYKCVCWYMVLQFFLSCFVVMMFYSFFSDAALKPYHCCISQTFEILSLLLLSIIYSQQLNREVLHVCVNCGHYCCFLKWMYCKSQLCTIVELQCFKLNSDFILVSPPRALLVIIFPFSWYLAHLTDTSTLQHGINHHGDVTYNHD